MATAETIRDNLAYLAQFGNYAPGTFTTTRIACYPYVDHVELPSDLAQARRAPDGRLVMYALNDAGRELAAQSPLARCFEWLRENGFRLEATYLAHGRRVKGSFIMFKHDIEERTTAFISSWTRVYVNRPNGKTGSEIEFDGTKK